MDLYVNSQTGPLVRYTDAHMYLAMYEMYRNGSMSRKKLTDILGIGEGSVRTMVNQMKEWGVIETRQTGIRLTKFGEYTFENIPFSLMDAYSNKYAIGECQQGVLVRDVADKVTDGRAQRDSGIRNGSNGASVFIIKDGKLIFPKDWDVDREDPLLAEQIRSTGMKEGDVFLLVGSDDMTISRISAVSIALEML